MALTQQQIDIVKSTAPILREHGETVTGVFYKNLLTAHPALKNYFSLRNQQTGAQQAALAKSVLAYATYIEDPARLTSVVERIAQKHASLFVKPEQYPIVGEFLIGAFGEVLGDGLTPEVKDAWVAAYNQLADVFIQREKQLYEQAGEWQSWRKFRISGKERHNDSVTHFYLEPVDGRPLIKFLPGQYVSLQIPIPQLGGLYQSRQFSLSEAPKDGLTRYRVSVKKEEGLEHATSEELAAGKVVGLVSNMLHHSYEVGDEVELSPPRGEFYLQPEVSDDEKKPLVLISAGVGATPMVAILDSLLERSASSRPIQWIHTAKHSGNACFTKKIREVAKKHSNFQATVFLKSIRDSDKSGEDYDRVGRMTTDRLEEEKLLPLDNKEAEYFICGPEEWMLELRGWLESKGVERQRQHLELFKTGDLD
ncbi:Flavohemoprotein-like protein [Hapsidospora chrysogenum ATCC 11550]|uniref:nitric oxide dioxygenase n=1 Tax=Hapsidospora chrysogenum (strain ATCC 11550 / CBS 779.69 / DSM 880 / IAM 14645 / JCM 23072 / IMI 49137) TaxID=857340 RepID=A0A086STW9_HAPC1|nr:Flavohemoprotein-like protein [Hapsidospora chrysogenum ATCC 11550]